MKPGWPLDLQLVRCPQPEALDPKQNRLIYVRLPGDRKIRLKVHRIYVEMNKMSQRKYVRRGNASWPKLLYNTIRKIQYMEVAKCIGLGSALLGVGYLRKYLRVTEE